MIEVINDWLDGSFNVCVINHHTGFRVDGTADVDREFPAMTMQIGALPFMVGEDMRCFELKLLTDFH
jgi:hypothetical protein